MRSLSFVVDKVRRFAAAGHPSVGRCLIPLTFALFAAGCSDEIGRHPAGLQEPVAAAPHFLRWAGTLPPRFSAIGANSGRSADSVFLATPPGGLSLDQYTTSFWAVRGELRSIQINYLSATGDTSAPFLRLASDDPAYDPGRGDLALGDSVLITVTIDPYNIKVSLEPTGLVFGSPAQLQVSYGGAAGDMNGDGVVDDADAYIESQLLGMWYREGADSAWTKIPATQSIADKAFTSALQHFCQYAVSW